MMSSVSPSFFSPFFSEGGQRFRSGDNLAIRRHRRQRFRSGDNLAIRRHRRHVSPFAMRREVISRRVSTGRRGEGKKHESDKRLHLFSPLPAFAKHLPVRSAGSTTYVVAVAEDP